MNALKSTHCSQYANDEMNSRFETFACQRKQYMAFVAYVQTLAAINYSRSRYNMRLVISSLDAQFVCFSSQDR